MANDAGRVATCWCSFKPHDYKQRTKNEGPSEKTRFNGEQFEIFKPKTKYSSHRLEKKEKEPQDPGGKNWTWTM